MLKSSADNMPILFIVSDLLDDAVSFMGNPDDLRVTFVNTIEVSSTSKRVRLAELTS